MQRVKCINTCLGIILTHDVKTLTLCSSLSFAVFALFLLLYLADRDLSEL